MAIQERQAWNEHRRHLTEEDQLASFSSWLCDRAASYQNAYDEEPSRAAANQTTRRRVHHQLLQPDPQHCAKCNGRHRLEHCPEFSSLDRWISPHRKTCASHASGPTPGSSLQVPKAMRNPGLPKVPPPAAPRSTTESAGLPRPSRYARRSCSLRGNPSLPPRLGWPSRSR